MIEQETVPCELCGKPTSMLGTKRCHGCWELESRIKVNPEMARKILAALDPEKQLQIRLTFDEKTFAEIRTAIFAKGLCAAAYGILDAFTVRMVEKVIAGEEEWHVIKKTKQGENDEDEK